MTCRSGLVVCAAAQLRVPNSGDFGMIKQGLFAHVVLPELQHSRQWCSGSITGSDAPGETLEALVGLMLHACLSAAA